MPPPPPTTPSPAKIKLHPTNAYKSEEIRSRHINVWQHYLCPTDIQHYELGSGIEGLFFEYEFLAAHAVLLNSKELLAIGEKGLLHKRDDLAGKIKGTKIHEDRLSFQYRHARAEMGLLNGKERSFWAIAPGTLKLVKSDQGIVRYDGFKIYINDTPHEGNETDYVEKLIVFKEVEDKSGEKRKSTKEKRSQILTPESGDSGDDSSTDSGADSSIEGRVSKKEEKLEDIFPTLSLDKQKQLFITFMGSNGFDSLK